LSPIARRRGLATLFAVVAALHLLPIWRVQYLPTVDGPAHLYNAVILRELAAGTPEFTRTFFVDLRPHPNWLTHLLLAAALGVAPLVVAEKLVVSMIVLLFLGGCWRLAGVIEPERRVYAFLLMPLAYHLLFQMGFYNYSLAVALVPFALASWWERRERPGWRTNAITAGWLVLCYFAHVLPAVVAVLFLLIMWSVSVALRGWRTQWPHLIAFVPVTALLAWFFLQPKPPGGTWIWSGTLLWKPLLQTFLLLTFDPRQLTFGTAVAIALGTLIVLTFVRETMFRERDVFLLLALAATAMYLVAPVSAEEGLLLKARLLIFPYLVILPWLTSRLGRLLLPLAVAFAIVATANVFFLRDAWKRNDKVMARAILPLRNAAPLHTIVPLIFDRTSPHATLPLLSHAISYAAAGHRLVDLANYEAGLSYFPIQFRPTVRHPPIFALQTAPADFDPRPWANEIDYIYTWKMPPDAPLMARLHEHYDLTVDEGEARLYARRAR
jgi:hypothetical protein